MALTTIPSELSSVSGISDSSSSTAITIDSSQNVVLQELLLQLQQLKLQVIIQPNLQQLLM